MGGGDTAQRLGVQACRVGRGELAGQDDARLGGAGALLAGDRRDDAAPHVQDVRRALAQERVVEAAVEPGDLLGGVVPRALRRRTRGDGGVGGLEQRLVVEQGQVGVEDGRLGVAGARGNRLAVASDRLAGRRDGLVQALAFALGRVGRALGRRPVGPPRWRAGPIATPAEAATPESTWPDAGAATSAGSAAAAWPAAGTGAPAASAMPSPKPSSASARSAASASAACGPDALTTSVSPKRAPSATTLVRLVARTGAPPPALATRTSAS